LVAAVLVVGSASERGVWGTNNATRIYLSTR